MAFLYLDPLTDRRDPLGQAQLDAGRRRLCEAGPGIGIHEAFVAFDLQPKMASDARIARVVLEIERRPDTFGHIRDAAELAGLSPSRFRARFAAQMGLPFRRYRLWRRMALAMHSIAQGSDLTDAAFACGFSSSAHLSTSFKRMFGLSPSEIMALGAAIDTSQDQVGWTGRSVQRDGEAKRRTA